MYLQLAEAGYGGYPMTEGLSAGIYGGGGLSQGPDPDNYIFMPDGNGGGEYWHMKNFDGMAPRKFDELLEVVAPYQPMNEGLSAGAGAAQRRAFKDQKQQQKLARDAAKTAVIEGRAAKKQGAAQVKISKAGALDRGEGGKGAAALTDIVGKVAGAAGQIFGKGGGGGDEAARVTGSFDVGPPPPPVPEPSFFEKNKTIIMVVGGIIVIGGIAYFATRK
jgi:hypothetical protein